MSARAFRIAALIVVIIMVVTLALLAIFTIGWQSLKSAGAEEAAQAEQAPAEGTSEAGTPAEGAGETPKEGTETGEEPDDGLEPGITPEAEALAANPEAIPQDWKIEIPARVHFYNLDLQNDNDANNNWNFGPNPLLNGKPTVFDLVYIFKSRLDVDPALTATTGAWVDVNAKTEYEGEFYETAQYHWETTMNNAKLAFMANPELHKATAEAIWAYLRQADDVYVRKCTGLTDQMYMNPYTINGIPDICVLESFDQTGYELVFVIYVKGTGKIEIAFRVDCGFQPTNVGTIMGIKPGKVPAGYPQKPPAATSTPSDPEVVSFPSDPEITILPTDPEVTTVPTDPKPTTNPETPSTKPKDPPAPSNPKKPENAPVTNTEPNNTPGPGPDTNNGPGAQWSKVDPPTGSAHLPDYPTYVEVIEDLKEVQEEQKVGGDPNTPSTPPPSPDTTVDSNADKGTGYGGIDQPTPVSEPVHNADTGKADAAPVDNAGEAWEGPLDG